MTTTLDTITLDQIRALKLEAEQAGDEDTVIDCTTVLAREVQEIGPDYFRHFSATLRLVDVIRNAEVQS